MTLFRGVASKVISIGWISAVRPHIRFQLPAPRSGVGRPRKVPPIFDNGYWILEKFTG
jgi:hypothetical protein